MVMVLSSRGSHNGFSTGFVARHYSEESLPGRYLPAKKSCKPRNRAITTGQDNGNSVLTAEAVYEIRKLFDQGKLSHDAIALRYHCSPKTVSKVGRRQSWKHLPERTGEST